jgi:hypothetical protein
MAGRVNRLFSPTAAILRAVSTVWYKYTILEKEGLIAGFFSKHEHCF